ncbi:MAG TPA: hypothetical protein VLD86_06365, partial [Ilumatobacteraceae bacterium]|nr:hypothetical protein [Ilumatobacteraceae bacterium]
ISKRLWRSTHYLSFPLFFLSTVHALSAGTDRAVVLLRATILVATALIALMVFIRLTSDVGTDAARGTIRRPQRPSDSLGTA